MLRVSLRSSRAISNGSIAARAGRQWLLAGSTPASKRSFADGPKPVVLPGSASSLTNEPPPPGPVATSISSPLILNTSTTPSVNDTHSIKVPLTPPPPPPPTGPVVESVLPTPPPPTKKPRKVFRRLFTTLLLLSIFGFGGGVYYSRVNDNFHDFFTEYVPFGEEAVLYFEEKEFRKRYPIQTRQRVRDTGDKVTIPSQSGVSWKVSQDDKISNALDKNAASLGEAKQTPQEAKAKDKVVAVQQAKKEVPEPKAEIKPVEKKAAPAPEPAPAKAPVAAASEAKSVPKADRMPEVDEPSRFPSEVTRIDPINIKKANEPIVQDLVKMLNEIIMVVNADNANARFSSTIGKAKGALAQIGDKIQSLKDAAAKDAEAQIKASHDDFDRAAKELIKRLEGEMQQQEAQWKDDYEKERSKIQRSYEQKLQAEIERANQLNEQKLRNELLEQAVEMKRKFVADVKDRVEEERNGRLGKLSDLTNTVHELEKLTGDWNSVVDTNLKTQQLHVAVEAVRSSLENATTPKPFIRELAALKEIAADDPVVNAAISSINPTAYQRGVPSSAQLIDRFRRVAGEVRKASLLPEEAGVASHASSYVLSKLLFKKKGLADGDDVESILTRTETLLEEGNLDGAAREMNGLKGWAKTLSKDWLGEVRKVLEVQQALEVIATEARLQSLRVE